MTFVAPNLACGEARGGRIPGQWGCNRRATKPQAKFGATRRAAGLFRPDFVARSLQIHCGICSSLTPRLGEKSLAANVIVVMPQTTKCSSGWRVADRDGRVARTTHFQNTLSVAERLHQVTDLRVNVSDRGDGVGDLPAQEFTTALPQPMGNGLERRQAQIHFV